MAHRITCCGLKTAFANNCHLRDLGITCVCFAFVCLLDMPVCASNWTQLNIQSPLCASPWAQLKIQSTFCASLWAHEVTDSNCALHHLPCLNPLAEREDPTPVWSCSAASHDNETLAHFQPACIKVRKETSELGYFRSSYPKWNHQNWWLFPMPSTPRCLGLRRETKNATKIPRENTSPWRKMLIMKKTMPIWQW